MQVKTILNQVQKHTSFVYTDVRFVEGDPLEHRSGRVLMRY